MNLRRLVVGCCALGVLAVVGILPATAGTTAPKATCIGLVIDARTLGVSATGQCVTVKQHATGIDVLEAGGHTLTFRQPGFICTIDGLPKTGCSGVDDTHYWEYYHRAPGATTWQVSNEGAASYDPVNGSTEGWVYDDGTALKPQNIPMSQLVADSAAPPTPTPSPTPLSSTESTSHGSPAGAIVTAAILAVAIGATTVAARRRRR